MHALLSLAALHQVHLEASTQTRTILDRAVNHNNLALSKSKEALAQLSEHNSSNLFALSLMVGFFALALPISPASIPFQDAIGQIIQVATLMRGVLTITLTQSRSIINGPMSAMLRNNFSQNPAILPEELELSLNELETVMCSTETIEDGPSVFRETIQSLKACFRNAGFSTATPNGIAIEDQIVALSWLGMMHSDFVPLLSHRRPVALVVLSYYAVALHTLDAIWWCQGWGLSLVNDVYNSLDTTWRARMKWPMEKIKLNPEDLGVTGLAVETSGDKL